MGSGRCDLAFEESPAEAFGWLDGITVTLPMENWDSCGTWCGLSAFPRRGKMKRENVICKARGEPNTRQPELRSPVGMQVAAV